jgi:hypothetical protein
LIAEAVNALPVQSCVIDGEAVACDGDGLSIFEKLRWRHHDCHVFMWAFSFQVILAGTQEVPRSARRQAASGRSSSTTRR